MMNKNKFLFILYLVSSVLYADISLDPVGRTATWNDTDYSWMYSFQTGDWQWTTTVAHVDHTWTYNGTNASFTHNDSGEVWQYDLTYDVWVNSAAGVYDITTLLKYGHQVWRFVESTQRWHPVIRFFENDEYRFETVESVYWERDSQTGNWQYIREVTGNPVVPITQTWLFEYSTLTWQQQNRNIPVLWRYHSDFSTGQWKNEQANLWWRFIQSTDTQSEWDIVGYIPGYPWDINKWSLILSSGVWLSTLVQIDPYLTNLSHSWNYNSSSFLWENLDDLLDVRDIMPFFPPTPFAYYKPLIEEKINHLLVDGLFIGSGEGNDAAILSDVIDGVTFGGVVLLKDITKITMNNTVLLSGDIEFVVEDDALLIIGDENSEGSVCIAPTENAEYAQLIFNVAAEKVLEVQVRSDLYFKAGATIPLYLTFRGKGLTVFRMPSGRTISFSPYSENSSDYGVAVQVLMDLSYNDVVAGMQQLIFEPWSYSVDHINTRTDKTTWISFGRSSSLRFFSANEQGVDGSTSGYGAIAFDVAHSGTGRMIVDLAAGEQPGDRLDAGINVWGSLIVGTGDDESITSEDLRLHTAPHKRAGVTALMSIVDAVAFNAVIASPDEPSQQDAAAWVARGASSRRGLVILNHNKTYPHLAANLARAYSLQSSAWAVSQKNGSGYQPGFIVGDNGQIRIAHNLFLDYVACSAKQLIDPIVLAGAGATLGMVKLRNPAALIIDQVGQYAPSTNSATWDMQYHGLSRATVVLEGSAGCFFRAGASSFSGQCLNEITVLPSGAEHLDVTIGTGVYDGSFCPVLEKSGVQSMHESILVDRNGNPILYDESGVLSLDGEHVLDIEGACTISSVMGRFGFAPNGYITIPSIAIDHTGQEKSEVVR